MSVAVVGVGSNLGSREASIRAARSILEATAGVRVVAISPLDETAPVGPPQPKYLNAAFRVETTLSPIELLGVLLQTEQRLGRARADVGRWGARSLDLDLLWDERGSQRTLALSLPHPELEVRSFAMTPLLAVAPELEPDYGDALAAVGGALKPWTRAACMTSRVVADSTEVQVEADTLVDACALVATVPIGGPRPSSTVHRTLDSSASAFANALRELLLGGFHVHHATVSHCSKTQWTAHFHGANVGIPQPAEVRLEATAGVARRFRASLSTP